MEIIMIKRIAILLLVTITASYLGLLAGCEKKEKPTLLVYSGKGLKIAMEDIKQLFEQKYNIRLNIIYAGSNTLLQTIQETRRGDIYVPGSVSFIKKADEYVTSNQYVALHIPAFAIQIENPKDIQSFDDLLKPGIRLTVGNKNMCALGKVGDDIINDSGREAEFGKNIIMTGSTVNEMLNLIINGDVDAAMTWTDMMMWPKAKDLKIIKIPPGINKINKIHVAVLKSTVNPKNANLFANFVATEGKDIFIKHGFGGKK